MNTHTIAPHCCCSFVIVAINRLSLLFISWFCRGVDSAGRNQPTVRDGCLEMIGLAGLFGQYSLTHDKIKICFKWTHLCICICICFYAIERTHLCIYVMNVNFYVFNKKYNLPRIKCYKAKQYMFNC